MTRYYIYIDDSGDPGLKSASSSNFIIAAVVIANIDNRDKLENIINSYRQKLGWQENEELKFNKTNRKYVREAIKVTAKIDYEIYAMILDKKEVTSGRIKIANQEQISLYVIKELLRELAINNASIVIDGSYGHKYLTKARTYLRQQLKVYGIEDSSIHFVDSRKSALIQLADLAAGSVAKSLSHDEKNQEFIKLFGKKIKKIYRL